MMPDRSSRFWLAYGALALLWLLQFVPLLGRSGWLWGVGSLSFLPVPYVLVAGLLAVVSLILPFIPRARATAEQIATRFSDSIFESRRRLIWRLAILVVAGVIFAGFSMPTHFLGDGYLFLKSAAGKLGQVIKWSEPGAVLAARAIRSLLGSADEPTALLALRIISVVSGLVTIWLYFLLARLLSSDSVKRMIIFGTLLLSSSLLLFFGYIEAYPILWPAVTGFTYFGLSYARDGRRLVPALLCLLLAMALHLEAVMFVPAGVFLLFSQGRGLRLYKKLDLVMWGAVVVVAILIGRWMYHQYSGSLYVENIFLYLLSGKPSFPGYAVLSPRHISDLVNLFLLVFPAALVILLLGAKMRGRTADKGGIFLGLLSMGALLFALTIDPTLSMPRDWDLFAICCLPPMLLLLNRLPDAVPDLLRRMAVPVLLLSAVGAFSFVLVNVDEQRSVAQAKQIVDYTPERSLSMIAYLSYYYQNAREQKTADSLEARKRELYPDFFRLREAHEFLLQGEIDSADQRLSQVRPDKFSKDYHEFLAAYYTAKRAYDSAATEAEAMIQLQPYYDGGYTALSMIYLWQKEPDKSLDVLRRGHAMCLSSVPILTGLTASFASAVMYDSAVAYGHRAIELDSMAAQAYYFLAQSYLGLNQNGPAEQCARKYIETGYGLPGYERNVQQLRPNFPDLVREYFPEADSAAPVPVPQPAK